MSSGDQITRTEITRIAALIRPYVRQTPVMAVAPGEFGLGGHFSLMLKMEWLQHTASFKPRGAFASLLDQQIPAAGVVAASGGNHGAAVAYAAQQRGIKASIFVPGIASPAKLARIRSYGADLHIIGERYADALAASQMMVHSSGALAIHAYDQLHTLLGQGTIGPELEAQAPNIDTILVAVGGGGLIGGLAGWYRGRAKIVGVEPETAPTLHQALAAGRPVPAPAGGIAADSLAPQQVGTLMFPLAQAYVDHVALVEDTAIAQAQAILWQTLRIPAEPGGAAACAALLSGRYQPAPGERVAVLVCGANPGSLSFMA